MKRGEPPKRKKPIERSTKPLKRTALARPTSEQVAAWQQQQRAKQRHAKSKVRNTRAQQFMYAVKERAQGRCEVGVSNDCARRCVVEAHHVVTRKRGVGWPHLHDASRNGLGVCMFCHDWIHDHIAWAEFLGILRRRPSDDADPGPIQQRVHVALRGRT